MFAAKLFFPSDYPLNPFKMTFDPPLLHPNSECDRRPLSACVLRVAMS